MAVALDISSCIIVAQPLVEQNSRLPVVVRRIRRRAEAGWPKLWVWFERACISLIPEILAIAAGIVREGLYPRSTTLFFPCVGAISQPGRASE
ncbi:MAG TPA: hypothetical protein VM284_03045 [Candidatus Limnocylindria bacterium]|nr:hypothetical protein [Candidatus Limnocylindria bacterium]